MRFRTVPVEEAVGMVIPHDITEVRPGEFKGVAFKKGHIVKEEDIPYLKRLGKERIYVLEIGEGELHEDEAALRMASAVCGEGVGFEPRPTEGKVTLFAEREGLFKVEKEALYQVNLLGDVALSTRHGNFWVRAGEALAGIRAIPLVVEEALVKRVEELAREVGGILKVVPKRLRTAGLLITGNEVFYGRIPDRFAPIMLSKLKEFQLEVLGPVFVPDEARLIKEAVEGLFERGAELVLVTGGMSVDPDDVTREAIRLLEPDLYTYGAPVLPGNMFLVAYKGERAILGVPACGMFNARTVLDLLLPRVVAGERLERKDIAALGHGGFCLNCSSCRFPVCPFGRG